MGSENRLECRGIHQLSEAEAGSAASRYGSHNPRTGDRYQSRLCCKSPVRALHPYLPGALPVSREKLPDAFGLSATSVPEVRLRVLHQVVEVEPDCGSALFRLRQARWVSTGILDVDLAKAESVERS